MMPKVASKISSEVQFTLLLCPRLWRLYPNTILCFREIEMKFHEIVCFKATFWAFYFMILLQADAIEQDQDPSTKSLILVSITMQLSNLVLIRV